MFRNIFCFVTLFAVPAFLWMGGCESVPSDAPEKMNNQISDTSSFEEQEEFCKSLKYTGPFRGRWWHHYSRGLFFSEKGCWEKAEKDFTAAIERRGKDQWNARSYGMHFVDYFPHRELGIALYYDAGKKDIEKMGKARDKLELSLSQTPSAKSIYYLEKTYQDLIALEGKHKLLRPQIIARKFWTKDEPVVLSGTVKDKKYIKKISVNITNKKEVQSDKSLEDDAFEPVFILNSLEDFKRNLNEQQLELLKERETLTDLKTSVSFKKQFLFLPQGEYVATIKAENIMGGVNEHKVDIHVDRLGPMIAVGDKVYEKSDKKVTISGFLDDESGISSFFMNNQRISIKPDNSFEETIDAQADEKEVELVAQDQLGNETFTRVPLANSAAMGGSALFASAGVMDGNSLIAYNGDKPIIKIYLKGDDRSKFELKNEEEIYTNLFTINVEIKSSSEITSLKINDDDILAKEEFFHLKGMTSPKKNNPVVLAFDYAVDLRKNSEYIVKVNDKEVKITTDGKKNDNKTSVIILKKKRYNATDIKNRLSILVFPFSKDSDKVKISPQIFHEELLKALQTILIYTNYKKASPENSPSRFQIIPKSDMKKDFLNIVINPDSDADKAMKMGRNEEEANTSLIKDVLNSGVSGWENGIRFVVIGEIRQGYIKYEKWNINKKKPAILIKASIYETEKQKNERIQQLPIRIDTYVEIDVDNTSITINEILEKMSVLLAGKLGTEFPLLVGDIKKIKIDGDDRKTVVTTLSNPKLRINTKLIPYDQHGTQIGDGKIILPTDESEAEISKIKKSFIKDKAITENKVITE